MLNIVDPELIRLALFVGASLAGILIAMIAMGVIYTGPRKPLKAVDVGWDESPDWVWFAPGHLGREHEGKAPIIILRVNGKVVLRLLNKRVTIMQRNTPTVYDPGREIAAPGGRICLDKSSYEALEKTGWSKDQTVDVELRYRSWLNVAFLLQHPDLAVRVSAWIFLLTSLFGIFQTVLMQVLGY